MNYEQTKHKIKNIWNSNNSSKNKLDTKNKENELLRITEKRNIFKYDSRVLVQYTSDWFLLENGNFQNPYYCMLYYKNTKFTITDFPLQLVPNIRIIVYFKCAESIYKTINSGINYDGSAIRNLFEVIDMNLDEETKTAVKTINIWNEILFDNIAGDVANFYQIYCKLVITVANPRDYV
jgi:hypothetical protein